MVTFRASRFALKYRRTSSSAHFPCLILPDLAMPVMDGRGFLKLRAKDPMLRQIPVVVVSGNPPSGEPLNGIDAYLQKPVRFDRLIAIVDHR